MKKILALVLVALFMVGAVSAMADTVKIGGIAPLTGPVSMYGLAVRDAVDMYVEELNANGGVNGNTIEMVWMDDKHDQTEAVNAYNRLINDGVVAILGPVTTSPTLAIIDMATEDGIPQIVATATGDTITADLRGNFYRTCFMDSFQGKVMATFAAKTLNAKKVAILYDNTSDYSSGITESFVETAAALGMEVVAKEAGSEADTDFKAQLTNIATKEFDALFVPMYYGPLAFVVQQAHEIGISVPLLGVDGWDSILDNIEDKSLLEGYYFCNHSAADEDVGGMKDFRVKYEAKYGKTPNTFAALGYDTIGVLAQAIGNAATMDWEGVNTAMKAADYEGVTGRIRFDDHGDVIGKSGVINILTGGEQKFFERVTP